MNTITQEMLKKALLKIGVHPGDTLLIHSDLRGFGIPEGARTADEILLFYFHTLQSVLGEDGTLAVPAYFYEYARFGTPFDVDHSPVSAPLGSFSQWINQHPKRVRSCNPLQSIAAVGKRALELAGGNSLSGYGVTSPWHRLRRMGGKILFLGAPLQSMTFVHYIEQQYGVPHLYFKTYPYPIIKEGKQLAGHAISAVRYLDYAVTYDLGAFEKALKAQHAWHTQLIHQVPISIVDAETAYQIGISCLDKNPYFFLKEPPKFISGKIPMDGVTGAAHAK